MWYLAPNCEMAMPGNRDFLPIPLDVHWFARPGSNISSEAAACCTVYPPQIAGGCFEWCQIDNYQQYANIEACLDAHNDTNPGPYGTDLKPPYLDASSPTRGSMIGGIGLGVWALLVPGLVGTF